MEGQSWDLVNQLQASYTSKDQKVNQCWQALAGTDKTQGMQLGWL